MAGKGRFSALTSMAARIAAKPPAVMDDETTSSPTLPVRQQMTAAISWTEISSRPIWTACITGTKSNGIQIPLGF